MIKKLRVRGAIENVQTKNEHGKELYAGVVMIDIETRFGDSVFRIPFEKQPSIDAGIAVALEALGILADELKEAAKMKRGSRSP